jgi:hypothetical protein
MSDDLQEVIDQGKDELELRRAQRLADITEGDIELDPDLLDVGDEVADEVVSSFTKYQTHLGASQRLVEKTENRGKGRLGARAPDNSEYRAAAQKAMDIALEQLISPSRAYEIVGAEIGVTGGALGSWAKRNGLFIEPQRAESRGQQWGIFRREQIFDELLDVAQMLTTRMKVWIQDSSKAPDDWNAANELKTIAVAAAIAHDKRTGIEDIMMTRGLRDIDSEELQGELSAGKQRLLDMNGH